MRAVVNLYTRAVALLPEAHPTAIERHAGSRRRVLGDRRACRSRTARCEAAERAIRRRRAGCGGQGARRRSPRPSATDPAFSLRGGIDQVQALARRLRVRRQRSWAGASLALLAGTSTSGLGQVSVADAFLERSIELCSIGPAIRRQEAVGLSTLALSRSSMVRRMSRRRCGGSQEILSRSDGHDRDRGSSRSASEEDSRRCRGAFDDARASIRGSRRLFDDLGLVSAMLGVLPATSAMVEVLAGDPARAERTSSAGPATDSRRWARRRICRRWQESRTGALRAGRRTTTPFASARSARDGVRRGRPLAGPLARSAITSARPSRRAPRGRSGSLVRPLRWPNETDYLNLRADALMDLAEVRPARRSPRRSPRGDRRRPRPVPDEREPRRRRASTRSTGRIRSRTDGACVNGRSGLGQAVESAPLRAVGWRPHRQQEGRGTTPETTAWREPPRR